MIRDQIAKSWVVPVLLVIVLSTVAVYPLLRINSPCTHDGGLHYFRVTAMRRAMKQGVFFTRWLPGLSFGYGFPFFNYRAPLSYYLGLGFHGLELPLPLALNLVYVVSVLGCAVGAYLLGRDLFGPSAGVVAAVAYAYAPYQLLDALVRGNAPESVALALLPFILWAFRRLALEGGRRWFGASVGLLTALYLDHNISSLLFTPFLLAYLAVLWWTYRREGQWTPVVLALVGVLGLTSFFWLPALAEKGYVQLYLTGATRNNDFHYNFLKLTEIFAPPRPVDTSLMNPPLKIKLGLVQAVFAGGGSILGLALIWSQDPRAAEEPETAGAWWLSGQKMKEQKMTILFLAASAVLFVFMSTSASVWLWEHVPLLPFVQFPWRFVGRANLPVALLAGTVLLPAIKRAARSSCGAFRLGIDFSCLLPSLFVGILVLAALPSTYPPTGYCPMEPYPTIRDVHRYERNTGLVGVDPVGAYFPVWVQQRPEESPLETQYGGSGPISRLDEMTLPSGAHVLEADYGFNRARIKVESPVPFRARYLSFFFPGWRASVDGERVEIIPSDPQGLITFEVPSGRHTIQVRFGETSLRRFADVISVLSLLGLTTAFWLISWNGFSDPVTHLGSWPSVVLAITACLMLVVKLGVVDQIETPFRDAKLQPDGNLRGVDDSLRQPYQDGLLLLGYDQSAESMPADTALRVDLYWTVQHQPSRRYQTVVHLVGPTGRRWSPKDSFRPTDYEYWPATTTWDRDHYALDSQEIEPLPGTPPGSYDIVLTVFDQETLAPLSVLDGQGRPVAPEFVLGQVTLLAPDHPYDIEQVGIRNRLDVVFGPLRLLGAHVDHEEAAPGDPILLTTFWRAKEEPVAELTARLSLLRADGATVATYDLQPTADWHPTSTWESDQIWRGQHLIHLPAELESGEHTWRLSLPPLEGATDLPTTIAVDAPERTFNLPSVDVAVGLQLGDLATLSGVTFQPSPSAVGAGETLTTTLVWRAEAETDTSYRTFVHLIGPDGALVGQSDGVPAGWHRPTTGWLPGEYIQDVHVLTVPSDGQSGEYLIWAGLYTPGGKRLTTPDGAEAVRIGEVTVDREG